MTAYSKARIKLSRQLLAKRSIGSKGHGCDGCLSLPICKRLQPDEDVMCELDDLSAGIDDSEPGTVIGVRIGRAAA